MFINKLLSYFIPSVFAEFLRPSLGTIGSVVSIAGGLNSLFGGSGGGGGQTASSSQAQQAVDPFSSYRAGLGAAYNTALTQGNRTDITSMPGYSQFKSGVLDPAMEASKRSAAASGMLRSGREQIALEGVAQQGYYGFMTDYLNRLAQGSGATANPAPGGSAMLAQGNTNAGNFYAGLGGIAQGLGGLYGAFGSGGSSSSYVGSGGAGAPGVLGDSSGYMGGGQYYTYS